VTTAKFHHIGVGENMKGEGQPKKLMREFEVGRLSCPVKFRCCFGQKADLNKIW